jgi:hypothetical protein
LADRYIRVANDYVVILDSGYVRLAREGQVKTSIIGLALATILSGSLAAYGQTEPPAAQHHYHVHHYVGPHHTIHHHYVAHGPAMAPVPASAATAPAPQAGPFGLSLPHIAPYPDNKGDEDGLSEDQDDCNKGCIDGNTPD